MNPCTESNNWDKGFCGNEAPLDSNEPSHTVCQLSNTHLKDLLFCFFLNLNINTDIIYLLKFLISVKCHAIYSVVTEQLLRILKKKKSKV